LPKPHDITTRYNTNSYNIHFVSKSQKKKTKKFEMYNKGQNSHHYVHNILYVMP